MSPFCCLLEWGIYIPTTVNWSKKELVLDVRKWWRWNCSQQRNVLQNQWKWNTEGTRQNMVRAVKLYSRNKSILGADQSNPAPSIGILWDCWTLPNSALPLVPNPSNISLKSNTSHRKASNTLHCCVSPDGALQLFQEAPSLFSRVQLNTQSWLSQRHLWHPVSQGCQIPSIKSSKSMLDKSLNISRRPNALISTRVTSSRRISPLPSFAFLYSLF